LDKQTWVCPKCGGRTFKVLVRQELSEAYNREDSKPWSYTDATIDSEEILIVECGSCGEVLYNEWAPLCPKCGAKLEMRKFVDTWDSEGKPHDINENLYCPKCKIRWLDESSPHEFYEG
jgi:predicted RNA-binding Zn-ribbon protein involved in translation (DUF1610 family)